MEDTGDALWKFPSLLLCDCKQNIFLVCIFDVVIKTN